MNVDLLQDVLVITLNVASMLAMGLELTVEKLAAAAKRPRPMVLGFALNLVAAPLLAWLIWAPVALLGLPTMLGLGLFLCAAAPGGNVGPLFTANARGDVPYAVSLVVVLSLMSVATVPLLMSLATLDGYSGSFRRQATEILYLLLTCQIAPLAFGLALHAFRPGEAARAALLARRITIVSLAVLTIGLVVTKGHLILRGGLAPLIAIEVFVLVALASGLLLGSPRDPSARALSLVTCTRNLALSMLVGSQVFRGQPEVMLGVLAYGLLWLATALPVSFWLRRFA